MADPPSLPRRSNAWRTTSEEKRHQERLEQAALPLDSPYNYNAIRKASEVHRQVRQYARKNIRVGMTMTEIAEMIENATRALVGEDGLKAGIGFPTGVNRNHIAAHFSPNAGDKTGQWTGRADGQGGHGWDAPSPRHVVLTDVSRGCSARVRGRGQD